MFHRVSVQRLLSLSFLLGSLSCGGELGSMDPTEPLPPEANPLPRCVSWCLSRDVSQWLGPP